MRKIRSFARLPTKYRAPVALNSSRQTSTFVRHTQRCLDVNHPTPASVTKTPALSPPCQTIIEPLMEGLTESIELFSWLPWKRGDSSPARGEQIF
ncbi:hypothetical protein TNCT_63911 [Trichonephila clavata]|uniref:Uncharacterized protein n=1 Tax=Trichonephila clavata TaxID=2740835 RepID=A0A8X6GCP5_TRICU|nr:hypothetical protein TNCT_63911 [Trichonephila clavata]